MSKLYDLLSAMCGKIKKPDWNQNDPTAPDYVKNRPFYAGNPVENVLVEESTVSFTNPVENIYRGAISITIELAAGETYEVSWDGAVYECVCESVSGFPVIGNKSIMGVGADTGEPFVISPLADNRGTDIYTLDTSTSHAISISTFASAEVVKIPDKYISDTFRGIVTAGNPLKWSKDDWAAYYGLFRDGKLLKINVVRGSDSEGYVLSMYYSERTGITKITTITEDGGLYYLSVNSTTNKCYWAPVFERNKLYLNYTQTGSDIDTVKREEYSGLYASLGSLEFNIKKANEDEFSQKVVLDGDKEIVLSSSTANSAKKFRITVDDSGKPTFTNSSDSADSYTPTDLPTVTASDSGKFLRVSSTGEWVAETISSIQTGGGGGASSSDDVYVVKSIINIETGEKTLEGDYAGALAAYQSGKRLKLVIAYDIEGTEYVVYESFSFARGSDSINFAIYTGKNFATYRLTENGISDMSDDTHVGSLYVDTYAAFFLKSVSGKLFRVMVSDTGEISTKEVT